ncbi:Aste57867_12342 [Aphanomyces stellatus]|uniref:Aste57867_12342 protein n=1 Tax=Aphanomyces stellatus TaxID=120398 RepID=A0A485KXB4_9STRA|nr:hypothetical protein As57867_012296 [Aphanomyces stellatus]VFT89194.1 Aste57867_12342 [Aphanomyces stellatus]
MSTQPTAATAAIAHDLQVPRWIHRSITVFAKLKHATCAIYLAFQVFFLTTLKPWDLRNIHAFNPTVMTTCYAVLTCLHLIYLCAGHRRWRAITSTTTTTSHRLSRATAALTTFQVPVSNSRRWFHRLVSDDAIVATCNLFEVACQSYQLVTLLSVVVDAWFVTSFATVVVLHSLVTPYLFYNPTTSRFRILLVSWTSSLFSFCLSCLFPFLGVCLPGLHYLVVDRAVANDPLWLTRVLLISRAVVASSTLDFITKVVLNVSTLVSLHRLALLLVAHSKTRTIAPIIPAAPLTTAASQPRPTRPPHPTWKQRWLALHTDRPWTGFVLSSLVAWGLLLVILLLRTWHFRTACPPTCVAHATPLLDLTCRCKYVHVNCHAIGNESLDVDSQLSPTKLGKELFYLRVSRCDLPTGLSPGTLAAQPLVDTINVEFTNMTQWSGVLPSSTRVVFIRFSRLTTLPAILRPAVVPITTLYIEGSPIRDLPDDVALSWRSLVELVLINVSLTAAPAVVPRLRSLTYLKFQFDDAIGPTIPDLWQTQAAASLTGVTTLTFAGCGLVDGPWTLAIPSRKLTLSFNPIAQIPSSLAMGQLTARSVVLDDTTYCNATRAGYCSSSPTTCAPACLNSMVNNHMCNVACFNAACNFDGQDCSVLGLT